MFESLTFQEKINLIKYLYSIERVDKQSLEWYLKQYLDKNMIVTRNIRALLLYNLNKKTYILLNKDNVWIEALPEDEREIEIEGRQFFQPLNPAEYNKIVGFIGYEKKNKYMVFKTKKMDSSRDTGARCDEAGKSKTLTILNEIVGENMYTNEGTKLKKDKSGKVIQEATNQLELCVLQEFILRHFNDVRKNGKQWFLTPEMAIYYKLYKIII
jgi:hypothetical protein